MLDVLGGAFRNDIGALPIVVTVEHHQHAPAFDVSYDFSRVAVIAGYAEPHDVHGRVQVLDTEAGAFAQGRMTAIAGNGQIGTDFDFTFRRLCAHNTNLPIVENQVGRLRAHPQVESPKAPAVFGQEIEEIPLRHERDEFAMHRQVLEMSHDEVVVPDLHRQLAHLRMRKLEELFEQSEFVHHFKRRGVDGVATEIAQKIRMFFKHDDGYARTRQQVSKRDSGRSTAGDAAGGFDLHHCHSPDYREAGTALHSVE